MRRALKWLGFGLGGILCVLVLAAIYVWVVAGRIIDQTYDPPASTFVADAATANLEEGRRAALLRGCFEGCHGEKMEGGVWEDNLLVGTLVVPDLTRAFAELSDQDLDRVIRHGVRRDGKSSLIMPSSMLHHLSDADLNNITAFIRSQEQQNGVEMDMRPGLLARFMILKFGFKPHAQNIREEAPWLTGDDAHGKYLAITVCTECHGMDLQGDETGTPNLALAVAYSLSDFKRLMREGIPIGDRELDLMARIARGRFKHFTDAEIEALHSYLVTLAGNASSSPAD